MARHATGGPVAVLHLQGVHRSQPPLVTFRELEDEGTVHATGPLSSLALVQAHLSMFAPNGQVSHREHHHHRRDHLSPAVNASGGPLTPLCPLLRSSRFAAAPTGPGNCPLKGLFLAASRADA